MTGRLGASRRVIEVSVFLAFVAVVTLVIPIDQALCEGLPAETSAGSFLFRSGEAGYKRYRIPALLLTPDKTLLAFCEGRKDGGGLTGNIDIVLRRSTDFGKTWTDLELVLDAERDTLGNPCPVVDESTGRIWLLCTLSPGKKTEEQIINGLGVEGTRVLVTFSDDDGKSWAKPTDITDAAKRINWTWYGTGPGVGIQLSSGRLFIPSYHAEEKTGIYRSHSLYSDDQGKTWQIGEDLRDHTSESAALQRANGSIYYSARTVIGKEERTVANSTDGGATFEEVQFDPTLFDPHCQGSLLAAAKPPVSKKAETSREEAKPATWLYCHPAGPDRRNLTLHLSWDEGKTWPKSKQLTTGDSQYSSLAELPDGTIGCLYEAWQEKNYQVLFVRVAKSWLPAD